MDVEKTIQFMLEQQARFDAQFNARLDAQQALFEAQASRVEEQISRITEALQVLATTQERTNAIVATLAERHVELAEAHERLAEAHNATEQSLNALISTVERHIAGHP
ncbi:MAG TPA: hypothetical protein VFV34_25375 [Blastocatellia bacterium]|nr:hypothetical protein [Blastocatellia bacterium]